MRILRQGMTGDDVSAWQAFLVTQQHPLTVDGNFGGHTFDATEAFQSDNGLSVDGVVGHNTVGKAIELGFEPPEDTGADNQDPDFPPSPDFQPIITNAQAQAVFGKYDFEPHPIPGEPEHIKILGTWVQDNIRDVPLKWIIGLPGAPANGVIQFHRLGVDQLLAMWQAWEDAGLIDRVLTWGGSFVSRFVRDNNSVLSNHAFGSAFDINAAWNVRKTQPALVGHQGCVRELVEIANAHGFFWGGHFHKRPDGMHFDLAQIK